MLRVLPDGCADLVWDGEQLLAVAARATPRRFPVRADSHNIGLRLRPGAAGTVFGVPAHELPDDFVPLADLWGPAAHELAARLAEDNGRDAHALLERHVAARTAAHGLDPFVLAASDLLGRPGATVAAAAAAVGPSPRELGRRFLTHVGVGPKVLQRMLRFRAFLGLGLTADRRHGLATVTSVSGLLDLDARRLVPRPRDRWCTMATRPDLLGL